MPYTHPLKSILFDVSISPYCLAVYMRITLHHVTEYLYDRAVALGPQIIRLCPAPHYRGHLLSYSMRVEPEGVDIRWSNDAFANQTAEVLFSGKTRLFSVIVDLTIQQQVTEPSALAHVAETQPMPPAYEPPLIRELAPYRRTEPAGPQCQAYLRTVERGDLRTADFVTRVNQKLHQDIRYQIRKEHGVQTVEETLQKRSGSCRDSSWLLVQLLRHCGFAARFVSGYLIQLPSGAAAATSRPHSAVDPTELHAWCEVYLPNTGWTGLDPTSGLPADDSHVPLACAPDPAAAAPVEGQVEPCEVDFSYRIDLSAVNG